MIVYEFQLFVGASMWEQYFFAPNSIVSTLQTLLRPSAQVLEDLQTLCITALQTDIVPALTQEGLMPFANNYSYVFPYARMTKPQLKALIEHYQQDTHSTHSVRQLLFAQDQNFYYVKTQSHGVTIDEVSLLYGAVKLMREALVTSHVNVRGQSYACELEDADKAWYIDCTLFKIINSCRLHDKTMQKLAEALEEDHDTTCHV